MNLASTNCKNCGHTLEFDLNKKYATCEFCGSTMMVQDIVNNINYVVNNVVQGETAEELIKNGETAINIGNYALAQETYEKLTKKYPQEYKGWWGLIVTETRNFTKTNMFSSLRLINDKYNYTMKTCTDEAEKAKLAAQYNAFVAECTEYRRKKIEESASGAAGNSFSELNYKRQNISSTIDSYNNQIKIKSTNVNKANSHRVGQITKLALCGVLLIVYIALAIAFGSSVLAILLFIVVAGIDIKILTKVDFKAKQKYISSLSERKATVDSLQQHQNSLAQCDYLVGLGKEPLRKCIYITNCRHENIDPKLTWDGYEQYKDLVIQFLPKLS